MSVLNATGRVRLTLGGATFAEWTKVEITRNLDEMSASFSLELRDAARSIAAWPFATLAAMASKVTAGLKAEIAIDGEVILKGWADSIQTHAAEGQVSVSVSGSDKTRDLVDCAATVKGPAEHRAKKIDAVAKEIVKPYGLKVRAEVDVGDAFDRYAIDVGETALSAIEKGARQRGLLVTSDGIDSLVLTQSGKKRAPAPILFPGNAVEASGEFSVEGRHSEYHVKGQAERAGGKRKTTARLSVSGTPGDTIDSSWIDEQTTRESSGVTIHGSQSDADMAERYRPLVSMGRTQLTAAGAQRQAEWMERTARAKSEKVEYSVRDWRAGESAALWRPNQLVAVEDAYNGIFRDMLIAGVVFSYSSEGAVTRLSCTGPESYDTEPVGTRRTNHKSAKGSKGATGAKGEGALDSTAEAL